VWEGLTQWVAISRKGKSLTCQGGTRACARSDPECFVPEVTAISTNYRHNEQIRISPIRLVNDKEEQIGIVSTADALRMAREAGQDLVEVAPNARPPVCRIMDYGKWRYQQQKKEDKSRASSRAGQLKELKFKTVKIGDNDLLIKINHAREFLKEGNKVQFTLQFKGREMAHVDLGHNIFTKIRTELWPVSKVERPAKMEGRRMTMVLQPEHKPAGAKMPVPGQPAQKPGAFQSGSGLNIPVRPAAAAASPAGPGAPGAAPPAAATPAPAAPVAPARPPVAAQPVARPAPVARPTQAQAPQPVGR
jgi:translation initiation factor IF-3